VSRAPIARLYADLKRAQKDLKQIEVEQERLSKTNTYLEGLRLRAEAPGAPPRLLKAYHEAVKRSLAAAERIRGREEALRASIETEATYRESVAETRRRQQNKQTKC
jgi:hypothetical protein